MTDLTDQDKQQITDYLSHPLLFPADFKNWVADYVTTNIPKISVSQIMGFELWSIKSAAEITANESTSSTAYTALATAGPTLANLAPGFYIALWGANIGSYPFAASKNGYMGLSINGDAPTTDREAFSDAGAFGSSALLDLTTGSGPFTLTAKYKVQTTSRGFRYRWLHALKVVT